MTAQVVPVPAVLGPAEHTDPDRALLTYCDDATGERTELSAAALGSWAAKTANLLVTGCGLGRGARAAILLPPHWQTAAVLLGCWAAGLSMDFRLAATAGLPRLGPGADEPVDVVFAALDRVRDILEDVPEAPHRFVLHLSPLGKGPTEPPEGFRDYLTEVRDHRGDTAPPTPIQRGDPASVDGTSYEQWRTIAEGVAEKHGIRPGDRVLVDAAASEHPVQWLLTPLVAGASIQIRRAARNRSP